jgi:hypothetical protein
VDRHRLIAGVGTADAGDGDGDRASDQVIAVQLVALGDDEFRHIH